MKSPAELAARLRKMVLAAQHHYSPNGEPLRSIVVSPEWLEDMADAANALAPEGRDYLSASAAIPISQPLRGETIVKMAKTRVNILRASAYVPPWIIPFTRDIERAHGITQSRDSADPSSHG